MTAPLFARSAPPGPAPDAERWLPKVSGHHPALDGLRALAALLVLLFHVAASGGYLIGELGPWTSLLSRGEIGVPVFFALSGLLLYRPWAAAALGLRARPGTGGYLWKRALRLLPAYWLLVVAATLLYARDHLGDAASWAKLLTLTYSYDPSPWWGDYLGPKGMGQIWSLTVEAAFYVALPLLAAVLTWWAGRVPLDADGAVGRRARRLLCGLAGVGAVSMAYVIVVHQTSNQPFYGNWLPRYLIWFAAGMAVAVATVWAHAEPGADGPVRRFCRTAGASVGMCWTIAALCYALAATRITGVSRLYEVNVWTSEIELVLYGAVALFLVAPVALAPAWHPVIAGVLGNRVMTFLGKVSYGIFLWQFVVIYVWFKIVGHAPFTGNLILDFPVCAVLTVGAAAASHYLLEEPVRRLGSSRRSSPPPVSGPDRASGGRFRAAPAVPSPASGIFSEPAPEPGIFSEPAPVSEPVSEPGIFSGPAPDEDAAPGGIHWS
ncbi:acyltransferase family protein [Actinomadura atramentaria]|uniref:acyltransferase family protein n=1 Tax=Actinomadura atramentaria TaxID=1990 RepID=UPI001F0B7201|nr:acyltransferase [Actinomadura atramentaria]